MYTRFAQYRPLVAVGVLAAAMMFATTSVVVLPGDTLTRLAERHDVTVDDLVLWNDIENADQIVAGTILLTAPDSSDTAVTPPPTETRAHAVTAGDTLWLIARRYGASVATIVEANGLDDPNKIYIGQSLLLAGDSPPNPAAAPPAPSVGAPAGSTHTVRPGETLFGIARRYGVKSDALALNNQVSDPDLIRVGQQLAIPSSSDTTGSKPPPPSAPTPDPDPVPVPPSDTVAAPDATPSPSADKETSSSATPLKDAFRRWSSSYGVPQDLLEALTWKESNWQPSITGPGGHLGIGQLSPDTVEFVEERLLGLDLDPLTVSDGVQLAARYLRYLTDRTHSERDALAAWNQGLHGFLDSGMSDSAAAFADAVLEIRRIRS